MNIAFAGGFDDAPVQAAHAFRALMTAMARPGQIEALDLVAPPAPLSPAAGAALLTLCDSETGVFLGGAYDCPEVRDWLRFHTGAPLVGREAADFALGTWQDLLPLGAYRIGSSEYPDRSATLIVEMPMLTPMGATLRGPGIKEHAVLNLPDVPALQANAAQYPLGLDLFLTAGTQVAALPRSTQISEE